MIESNIIEWIVFGESIQKIDTYSKPNSLRVYRFYRELLKNRFPILLDILFMIISFFQTIYLHHFLYLRKEILL